MMTPDINTCYDGLRACTAWGGISMCDPLIGNPCPYNGRTDCKQDMMSDARDLLMICRHIIDINRKRRGVWEKYGDTIQCSQCGNDFCNDIASYCGNELPKFCPSCGADMRRVCLNPNKVCDHNCKDCQWR